jgi:hypothetical protein
MCNTVCTTADAGALIPGNNNNPDAGIPNFTVDAGAPWSVGTATCTTSACTTNCPPGLTRCSDGICYDTQNFHDHCGTCGNACAATSYCASGQCCPTGQEYCGTGCINPLNNRNNCGGCNIMCSSSQTCTSGQCTTACPATHNYALTATASASSGGGLGGGTVGVINDNLLEASPGNCNGAWYLLTKNVATPQWLELTWASSVTLMHMHIDTSNSSGNPPDICGLNTATLTGAQIQWWDSGNSAWVTDGTVSNQNQSWDYTFTAPVTTTMVRLYAVTAVNPACCNPFIWEWQVFGC